MYIQLANTIQSMQSRKAQLNHCSQHQFIIRSSKFAHSRCQNIFRPCKKEKLKTKTSQEWWEQKRISKPLALINLYIRSLMHAIQEILNRLWWDLPYIVDVEEPQKKKLNTWMLLWCSDPSLALTRDVMGLSKSLMWNTIEALI